MDLLQELLSSSNILNSIASFEGVKAAIRHIEIAERHLDKAREDRDDDLLNDVIYRTNQAFEGILKEAYSVLTRQSSNQMSPHNIEQHFEENDVLAPRVLELFKNYRRNWRNPSTHDHTIIFKDEEALLAIVSVSAFAHVLLNQIIEMVSYQQEKGKHNKNKALVKSLSDMITSQPLSKGVLAILDAFTRDLLKSDLDLSAISELEIIGRIAAFIESIDTTLKVEREPLRSGHRLDILISNPIESVILEFKRSIPYRRTLEININQVQLYLVNSDIQNGIIYVPPTNKSDILELITNTILVEDREMTVYYYGPKIKAKRINSKTKDH